VSQTGTVPEKPGRLVSLNKPANLAFNKIQRQYNRCCYLAAAVTASANVQLPAICTNCSLHRPLLDRTSMHSCCHLTTGHYIQNSKTYNLLAHKNTENTKHYKLSGVMIKHYTLSAYSYSQRQGTTSPCGSVRPEHIC